MFWDTQATMAADHAKISVLEILRMCQELDFG